MKDESEDFVPIKIPRKLFDKVSGKIESTDLDIVRKYIIYILRKELSDKKERKSSEKDKKEIIKRLGKLGYF